MISLGYALREMMIGAVSCLIVLSFLCASYLPSANPSAHTPVPYAHGLGSGSVIIVGSDFSIPAIISQIQNTISAVAEFAMRYKEYILDPLAWMFANLIIQQMTQSIVAWINSGFQGSPAFVQNFGGFLTGIADRVAGDFIFGNETTQFLCSPFRLDVQFALDIQYAKSRNFGSLASQCTLTGVLSNMSSFINGNFLAGGWDTWFKVTMNPQYNRYGAMLLAQEQFAYRLGNTKGQQSKILEWGRGFFSVNQCVHDESGGHCRMVTPGEAIQGQLDDALGSPGRRIAVADEINEILAALFSQLAQRAFSGVGGLLGLTGAGGTGGSGPTYYQSVALQGTTFGTGGVLAQNPIQTALTDERAYLAVVEQAVTTLQAWAAYKVDTYGADPCHSGQLPAELQSALTESQTGVINATNNIPILTSLLEQYNAAVGTPNAGDTQAEIIQQFLDLQSAGILHNQAVTMNISTQMQYLLPPAITAFQGEVDAACQVVFSGGGQ